MPHFWVRPVSDMAARHRAHLTVHAMRQLESVRATTSTPLRIAVLACAQARSKASPAPTTGPAIPSPSCVNVTLGGGDLVALKRRRALVQTTVVGLTKGSAKPTVCANVWRDGLVPLVRSPCNLAHNSTTRFVQITDSVYVASAFALTVGTALFVMCPKRWIVHETAQDMVFASTVIANVRRTTLVRPAKISVVLETAHSVELAP